MNKTQAQKNVEEYRVGQSYAQTKQIINNVNDFINQESKKGKDHINVASRVKWSQNIIDLLREEDFDIKREDYIDTYGYVISW